MKEETLDSEQPSQYLSVVRPLVEKAGQMALELRAQGLDVIMKPDGSPVSNADKILGEFLTQELLAAFPHTKVVSEEHSDLSGVGHELTWIIDPIDGTKKYVAGKEVWCVMVALFDTRPIFSLVYYPEGGAWYWAERGRGAYFEEEGKVHRLKINKPTFPLRIMRAPSVEFNLGEKTSHGFMKHARRIMWDKLDLYVRGEIDYWDLVPPMLIMQEAGAAVTDFDGEEIILTNKDAIAYDVVVCHKDVINDCIDMIKEARGEEKK